jgi:hypothetical protein
MALKGMLNERFCFDKNILSILLAKDSFEVIKTYLNLFKVLLSSLFYTKYS